MTKLNVVIPAVNVTVDGVEFRKVDRKAQAGDIVKITEDDMPRYVIEGAFYEVDSVDSHGDPQIIDEDGDEYDLCEHSFEVYAPVIAGTAESSAEITFEGATYRKVDRSAREGDVIVFERAPRSYLTSSKPYLVNEIDSAADAQITDDDGDDYDTCGKSFDVYEKVSVEYREVKRWAEKGERIRIVNRESGETRYEQGADFIVNSVDGDGDVRVTAGGIDYALVYLREYAVLEPIVQPFVYLEVKRKASVGERIKIVNAEFACGHYENGTELTVTAVARDVSGSIDHVKTAEVSIAILDTEYVVLEPVNTQAKAEPARLTVGNYAKIIADAAGLAEIGAIIKITKDRADNSAPYDGEYADGTATPVYFRESELEAATEAEFLSQHKPEEPKFNVGDSVKLTIAEGKSPHYGRGSVKNGDVGTITATFSDRISVDFPNQRRWSAKPEELTKLSAEEASAIEKEAQETAKWAKLGRKVGEFKRGDIVEATRGGKKYYGNVEDVGDDLLGVRMADRDYQAVNKADSTLIAPVEQRFDSEQAAA